VQIYVDDIIFDSTNASLCKEFSKLMQDKFEMSMMGELKFFLGIQINQCKDGVYVHQTKYTKELLKKFKLELQMIFFLKSLRQKHTLLTSQPTLSDFRPYSI